MNFLRTVPRLNAPIAAYSPLHCRFFVAAAAWTISDVVKEDHRELKAYYHKMIGEHDTDTKERYKNQFSWLLAKHAVGEEIVLYPAYEKYMGAFGKQAADKDRMSHQVVGLCN